MGANSRIKLGLPRQSLSGVFNKTALINYENYRRYFPICALARYAAATA